MTLDEDLAKRIAEDAVLSRVLAKADSGTADFTDTSRYHDRMAEIVGAVMREHVLEVPAESRSALCERVLRARYRDSAELLSRVQEALDAALGIRLAPQIPAFQTERAKQIGNSLADQTVSDETIQRRAESASANVVRAFQDRYVQENVRFRTDAGLKCWIVRDAGAKCCDWCAGIDGKYEYGSEPKDVYGRHDNCTCTVTYENGRKRQDVWSKRTWEQPEPGAGAGAPTVFGEGTRPRESKPGRLTDGAHPAIMRLPDIQIGRSVGAKARTYDIVDPETGEIFHFAEGTRLQDVQVFAGKGTRTPLHEGVAEGLSRQFGGTPAEWQHVKGHGIIDYYGEMLEAEVHWFQEPTVGKVKFKVKRWDE